MAKMSALRVIQMKNCFLFLFYLTAAACGPQNAEQPAIGPTCEAAADGKVAVEGGWLREQKSQHGMSAAYFALCNGTAAPVTLVGLTTPIAVIAEFHETARDEKGIVMMAPIGPIIIQAGERLAFEPGGKHVMLMGLTRQIESGENTLLTLKFSDGSTLNVEVSARSNAEAATQPSANKRH